MKLLPTSVDANWTAQTWATISGATPDASLTPALVGTGQVVANQVNTWNFASGDLDVLRTRVNGSGKLSIRTQGDNIGSSSRVQWYSGNATNATNRPKLSLTFSPIAIPNQRPIANAGRDQTVTPGTLTTLAGGDSNDPEGAVTYSWATVRAPEGVTLNSSTIANPTFAPEGEGDYVLSLTVTDSASLASTADLVTIHVAKELPPSATGFLYDGNGARVKQTKDGIDTKYLVDPTGDPSRVLMETTGASTTYMIYGLDLLYTITTTGPHYQHHDALGSVIAITDSTGAVEQTYAFDVFGLLRAAAGSFLNRYTFTGEEDDASGLVYLRARYLNPTDGRFLSPDLFPADTSDTQTVNRYVYVKNNPTNYVDPSGKVLTPAEWGWLFDLRSEMNSILPGDLDVSDALRHSITSKIAADHLGGDDARRVGLLNEYVKYNAALASGDRILLNSTLMDIWNNNVGLKAAANGDAIDWRDLLVMDMDGTLRAPTRAEYDTFSSQYPEAVAKFYKVEFE